MSLDPFGSIAAAEIAFYVPVLFIAFCTAVKHGFSRRQGWVFLLMFSLIRIVGAIITLVSKTTSRPQIGLIIAAAVLSGIGLSPLMLATHCFVAEIAQHALPSSARPLRLTRILLLVALIIAAVGGSIVSPEDTASKQTTGHTLTQVSVALFVAAFVILFVLHVVLWSTSSSIPSHHRRLLSGVSLALPPLCVRLVYACLGVFATSLHVTGDWKIYLCMALIMEFLVVTIYVTTGILIPIRKDDEVVVVKRGRNVIVGY